MKKKLLTAILVFVAALSFVLVGCDNGKAKGHRHFYDMNYWFSDGTYHWHECSMNDGFECDAKVIDKANCVDSDGDGACDVCKKSIMVHVLTRVEAKASTCTKPGNIEYFTCSHCDKWFTDERGLHEVTVKGLVAESSGGVFLPTHNFVDGECSVCHIPEPSKNVVYAIETSDEGEQYARVSAILGDETNVVIAADYLGVPVTIIDSSANRNTSVQNLVIPDSVKTIGGMSFRDYTSLASVKIGNGVEIIEEYAFNGCTNLSSVTFGSSVKVIESYAFGDTIMTEITFPDSLRTVGYEAFTSTTLQKVTFGEGIEEVGDCAFRGCSALSEVAFPKSLKKIGQSSFAGCGFTELTIPGNVKNIDQAAFQECTSLTSVVLEEGVEVLFMANEYGTGFGPFEFCSELASVTLPNTIKYIGNTSFRGTKLTKVDLSGCTELTHIGTNAFSETLIEEVVIPNSVETMDGAFQSNEHLTKVTLGTGLTSYNYAFSGCTALATVIMPEGLKIISSDVFAGCKVTKFEIPSTVTKIDSGAFFRCGELVEITIPESVTTLGVKARIFEDCGKLKTVTWNATCEFDSEPAENEMPVVFGNDTNSSPEMTITIGNMVTKICPYLFARTKIKNIVIPQSVKEIGSYAFYTCELLEDFTIYNGLKIIGDHAFNYCRALADIKLVNGLTSIGEEAFSGTKSFADKADAASDGVVYINEYLIKATNPINADYTIENGTALIADAAFAGSNMKIKNLTIPGSVVTIGNRAFSGSGVSGKLVFPSSVKTIGDFAFAACNMDEIKFDEGLESIGEHAFDGCDLLTSIEFPESLKTIGWGAFFDCQSLVKVEIGSGLEYINDTAFQGCPELRYIDFDGTYEQWLKVGGGGAVPDDATLTCTDGKYDSKGNKKK